MIADLNAVEKLRDNPFYVLGLRPEATRQQVEREGQKLLGMLELKLGSAARYPTPVGPGERTADKVRVAMAELRDPERRLGHELWARLEAAPLPAATSGAGEASEVSARPRRKADAPWAGALALLGWRSPR